MLIHTFLYITVTFYLYQVHAQGYSGSGITTRYWDCCKPSCAWPNSAVYNSVQSCDLNDQPMSDNNVPSACESGGTATMCSSQSPWAVSDSLAYGFAAVSASNPKCCTCYQLTFTDTAIAGKQMIVQITNTGTDASENQFDLAVSLHYDQKPFTPYVPSYSQILSDPRWWLWPFRRLHRGMGCFGQRLGCPIRRPGHRHMPTVPTKASIRMRISLGLDGRCFKSKVRYPSLFRLPPSLPHIGPLFLLLPTTKPTTNLEPFLMLTISQRRLPRNILSLRTDIHNGLSNQPQHSVHRIRISSSTLRLRSRASYRSIEETPIY